jgi:hypothetical protein
MSMREVNRVVIIADYLLKDTVLSTILELGAKGYNVSTCFGKGQHEDLGNVLVGSGLIRVETLAPENVARAIIDFVGEPRWREHALSAYVDTVEVDSRYTNV